MSEKAAIAPEPVLRAALGVLHLAGYTTRNWTLDGSPAPRKQINDLWEAIHPIPAVLTRWRGEAEILMYLDEYDKKWPSPKLRATYEALLRGANG